MYSLNKKC